MKIVKPKVEFMTVVDGTKASARRCTHMAESKHCGECRYNRRERTERGEVVYSCGNEASELYGLYTAYTDGCEEWEED